MIRIRNLKLIVIIFLLVSTHLYSQTISFTEAQEIMHKNNSLVKAAEKQKESQEFELKSVKGMHYPKIGVSVMGLYLDKEYGADLNDMRNKLSGMLGVPKPDLLGNWDIGLLKREIFISSANLTLPIFTGGKINAAVNSSKIKVQIGEKEVISAKNKLISELTQRYYQVQLAEEAVSVRKQVVAGMNKHLYNATKLEEQGIIAPVEKLQADVAASEAKRQYLAAQKDASLARVALANTLEVDKVSEKLISGFFMIWDLRPLEYYQESAKLNYPELQKLQLQKDLSDQNIKVKKSGYYPVLAATGQASLLNNNPIEVAPKNSRPWMVGLTLSYTIFEGFKTKNEISSAKALKESVEFYEQKAQRDIKTLIEKIYEDLEKQKEQVQNLDIQIEQAQELVRVRNRAFSEGIATSTDVVDAEMNLSGIRLQRLQASYDYVVDLATLLEYSGLSEDFIQYTY